MNYNNFSLRFRIWNMLVIKDKYIIVVLSYVIEGGYIRYHDDHINAIISCFEFYRKREFSVEFFSLHVQCKRSVKESLLQFTHLFVGETKIAFK